MHIIKQGEPVFGVEILKCPVNNIFHKNEGGCFLIRSAEMQFVYHVFNTENITLSSENQPIYNYIDFDNNYKHQTYFNANGVSRFFTQLKYVDICIENVMTNGEFVAEFIKRHTENYLNIIKPEIVGLDLEPKLIYDTFIFENNRIGFYRPIRLTIDRQLFLTEHLDAILEIIKIYTRGKEFKELHSLKKDVRERTICSASYFKGRNTTPELKCEYVSESACNHIIANSFNNVTLLHKPEKLCTFLLEKMINDHDESLVNAVLGFDCKLKHEDDIPLVSTIGSIYGRNTTIHRLCLPNYLVNEKWYLWMLNVFKIEVA